MYSRRRTRGAMARLVRLSVPEPKYSTISAEEGGAYGQRPLCWPQVPLVGSTMPLSRLCRHLLVSPMETRSRKVHSVRPVAWWPLFLHDKSKDAGFGIEAMGEEARVIDVKNETRGWLAQRRPGSL
jgi:hypothetical protein